MNKYKLVTSGNTYYLAVKKTGKLLYGICRIDSPNSYEKALARVEQMNRR